MTLLHRLASVVHWITRRDQVEHDLNDEMQAFVELSAAEKMRDGIPPAQARRLAVLELGGVEQTKERVRTGRHGAWVDEVGRDVRYACRMFASHPGFTFVIVLTLALGIGANTAIFSLIDALVLRWLPVRNPQELVLVMLAPAGGKTPGESFSYPIARALADQREIFAGATGFSSMTFEAGAPGSMSRVSGAVVTGAYHETLGLAPAAGRLIERSDDEAGAPLVAVISHGFWTRQFAASGAAVGQQLFLNGVPVTIVGVSPAGFAGTNVGQMADVTITVAAFPRINPQAAPLLGTGNFWLRVLARPHDGVSIAAATSRLNAVWAQISEGLIASHWPASRRTEMKSGTFHLAPGGTGWTFLRERYVKPLLVLMAMVVMVLLIACANVATLLLARASVRQREIAVRLAIGAGRGRIVRQLLVESTLLSLMGAACGIGLAWISGRFVVSLISDGPSAGGVRPDAELAHLRVHHRRRDRNRNDLRRGAGASGDRRRTVSGVEKRCADDPIEITCVAVAGQRAGGAVARSPGRCGAFRPNAPEPPAIQPGLQGGRCPARRSRSEPRAVASRPARRRLARAGSRDHERVHAHAAERSDLERTGRAGGADLPERDTAYFVGAGPRFFSTMGIPMLAGREFTEGDSADAAGVAVVNEGYAQRFFANRNPVGEHLTAIVRGQKRDLEIVGLARNTRIASLRANPPATVYVAYAQLTGDFPTTIEIRASGALGQIASAVRSAVQARVPSTPVDVRQLSAQVSATMVQERMMATLAAGFGLLALTLASVGLYGLLAYTVTRRTREIGIRMALGAQRRRVVGLVLKGAARLVIAGIALGLPAAWAASRWVESMLFGLKATDPAAIVGSIVLLAAVAQLAAYLPAWRASHVDPLTALRHE